MGMEKKRVIAMVLGIILCLALVVTMVMRVHNYGKQNGHYNRYASVEIEGGDTLTSICRDHYSTSFDVTLYEYIDDVVIINGLGDRDHIEAGNHVIVPIE